MHRVQSMYQHRVCLSILHYRFWSIFLSLTIAYGLCSRHVFIYCGFLSFFFNHNHKFKTRSLEVGLRIPKYRSPKATFRRAGEVICRWTTSRGASVSLSRGRCSQLLRIRHRTSIPMIHEVRETLNPWLVLPISSLSHHTSFSSLSSLSCLLVLI